MVEVSDGGVQSEPVAEEVGVQALVDVRNVGVKKLMSLWRTLRMYLLELEPELKEEVVQEELVEYGTELNVVEEGEAIPVLVEHGTEVDVREVPAGDASEATPELDEQGTGEARKAAHELVEDVIEETVQPSGLVRFKRTVLVSGVQ